MTTPLRVEAPVSYQTTLKRTLVKALKSVFTAQYGEAQFQNLRVSLEYPLTQQSYPAIYVRYEEQSVTNAGVGHVEYFTDPLGVVRKWRHRLFQGHIEFVLASLTPLDRDVLSDALVEILSFSDLSPLWTQFAYQLYGDPATPFSQTNLLYQIALNTDSINAGGESVALAPWEPEDVLVYTKNYSCDVYGGFYNSPPTSQGLQFVRQVDLGPYAVTEDLTFKDPDNAWSFPFSNEDADLVFGYAFPSATDAKDHTEPVAATGIAIVSASEQRIFAPDADTITGLAVISQLTTSGNIDESTVVAIAQPTAADTRTGASSATVTGLAQTTAADEHDTIDVDTLIGRGLVSAPDLETAVDPSTATGSAVISATDVGSFVEAGTPTGHGVPSASDIIVATDLNTITGTAAVSAVEFDVSVDAATVTGITLLGQEYTDLNTVTGLASVSASDLHIGFAVSQSPSASGAIASLAAPQTASVSWTTPTVTGSTLVMALATRKGVTVTPPLGWTALSVQTALEGQLAVFYLVDAGLQTPLETLTLTSANPGGTSWAMTVCEIKGRKATTVQTAAYSEHTSAGTANVAASYLINNTTDTQVVLEIGYYGSNTETSNAATLDSPTMTAGWVLNANPRNGGVGLALASFVVDVAVQDPYPVAIPSISCSISGTGLFPSESLFPSETLFPSEDSLMGLAADTLTFS